MALNLSKKVGPFPLGVWFVIVGGGLGVALYMRSRANADLVDTSQQAQQLDQPASDQATAYDDFGVGQANFSPTIAATPPPSAATIPLTQATNTCKAELVRIDNQIKANSTQYQKNKTLIAKLQAQYNASHNAALKKKLHAQANTLRTANTKLVTANTALRARLFTVKMQCYALGVAG